MCAVAITELNPSAITLPLLPGSDISKIWSFDLSSPDSNDQKHVLKTKSPGPGKRKKCVRFADSVGLPLVQSKEFKAEDELNLTLTRILTHAAKPKTVPMLQLCFVQSNIGASPLSHRKLLETHLQLSTVTPRDNTLSGTLLIHNICFEKTVYVRYSTDRWRSSHDVSSSYLNPVNRQVDLFQFTLVFSEFIVGRELEFCLCFRTVDGEEFWDNNYGRNYKVMVVEGVSQCREMSVGERRVPSVSPYW